MRLLKNLKIIIISIIITILITCVSIYAAYNYNSKDVLYTKSDGTTISVERALNELYSGESTVGIIAGRNNKKYKLIDEFTINDNLGYIPVLTSNDSSQLGTAFCSFSPYFSNTGAWTAFNGDETGSENRILYSNNENTTWGYVGFKTYGVLMKIKKITAKVCTSTKEYNYSLQYLDSKTNNWIDIKTGTLATGQWHDLEEILEEPIYTTSFRIYSSTYKSSGNNLGVISLQAYPDT